VGSRCRLTASTCCAHPIGGSVVAAALAGSVRLLATLLAPSRNECSRAARAGHDSPPVTIRTARAVPDPCGFLWLVAGPTPRA
jgi:hypothetical protein